MKVSSEQIKKFLHISGDFDKPETLWFVLKLVGNNNYLGTISKKVHWYQIDSESQKRLMELKDERI